jgi:hypothetical protein
VTVEHERYRVHIATECEAVERGAWCDRCHELCLLADAADWRVIRIAMSPEPATVG